MTRAQAASQQSAGSLAAAVNTRIGRGAPTWRRSQRLTQPSQRLITPHTMPGMPTCCRSQCLTQASHSFAAQLSATLAPLGRDSSSNKSSSSGSSAGRASRAGMLSAWQAAAL